MAGKENALNCGMDRVAFPNIINDGLDLFLNPSRLIATLRR